jgi:hypothetical protein
VSRNPQFLPRIMHHGFLKKLTTVSLYTSDEQPSSLVNGQESRSDNVIIAPLGSEGFSRSYTRQCLGNLSIAPDKLSVVDRAICHLAGSVSDVLVHAKVARVIDQEKYISIAVDLDTGKPDYASKP